MFLMLKLLKYVVLVEVNEGILSSHRPLVADGIMLIASAITRAASKNLARVVFER